jgi:hypothetical protein
VQYYYLKIQNNTREQAMLGEFDSALDDAVLDSNTAHNEQTIILVFSDILSATVYT